MKRWLICLILSVSFSSNVFAGDDEWLTASESLNVLQNGKLISSGQYKLIEGMHTSVFLIGYAAFYCEFDSRFGNTAFKCKQGSLIPEGEWDEEFKKLLKEDIPVDNSSLDIDILNDALSTQSD
jgi:hypothetical protein